MILVYWIHCIFFYRDWMRTGRCNTANNHQQRPLSHTVRRTKTQNQERPRPSEVNSRKQNTVEETINEHPRGSRGVQVGALGCERRYKYRKNCIPTVRLHGNREFYGFRKVGYFLFKKLRKKRRGNKEQENG